MPVVENGLPGVLAVKIIPLLLKVGELRVCQAEGVPSTFKAKQPLYLGDSLPCCLYNCIVVKV